MADEDDGDDRPELDAFGRGDAEESATREDRPDDATSDGDAVATTPVAELDREARVELGVELLAHVEVDSLSVAEAVDRIETVTTNPTLTREILDTAELRGVVDREEGRLRTRRRGTAVRFDEEVIEREGDYECRRCGASLSTGHFVQFGTGELGPFGPACVRAVLGRESRD